MQLNLNNASYLRKSKNEQNFLTPFFYYFFILFHINRFIIFPIFFITYLSLYDKEDTKKNSENEKKKIFDIVLSLKPQYYLCSYFDFGKIGA